jgi:hypothetical protein
MSLTDIVPFDKEGGAGETSGWRGRLKPLFLTLVIILTAILSFGLGRLSAPKDSTPMTVRFDENLGQARAQSTLRQAEDLRQPSRQTANVIQSTQTSGEVVASKNGSKYHYSHCPGAKQIKEENRLFFPSAAAAEASGYTLAGNCEPR